MEQFLRSALLLGTDGIKRLSSKRVAIFGLGGVGSYVAEGLCRCGIGSFALIDSDNIELSNINRQIIATHLTIGQSKVQAQTDRIMAINPEAHVTAYKAFYPDSTQGDMLLGCDYVVDCIDSISSKISLICECADKNIPIISSMGTGNKLCPTMLTVDDIYNTSVCPLCRIMRHKLRRACIYKLKVVYSSEPPLKPLYMHVPTNSCSSSPAAKRNPPGSVSFVPSVAGLILASEVITELLV